MEKIRLFEMFSGYGGASFALKKAGIPFECVGFSDIDKYAVQCYEQNHKGLNFGDCTKINPNDIPDFDLLTGGFPCQSFSVAGKGLGELDTRGTLFNEIIRIAEVKKPKFMLLENVKGLTNKKHKATFDKILSELLRIGYNVIYKVLNSKDYGIPQNRERIWFVCIRNDVYIPFKFPFPVKEELKIFLKDILEESVDEKYYLKQEQLDRLIVNMNNNVIKPLPKGKAYNVLGTTQNPSAKGTNMRHWCYDVNSSMSSLNATMYKQPPQIIQINNPKHSNNRVYSSDGISPTLRDMSMGGNRQPFVALRTNTKKGYDEAIPGDGIRLEQPNSKTARGRVLKQVSGTLLCNEGRGVLTNNFRIRKLTPKECFRLMGFLDDEINLEGISNSQRYKLAGNGWDINLVSKIFKKMFL